MSLVEVPALAISSTDCRDRVGRGMPVWYLVPDGVVQYIEKRASPTACFMDGARRTEPAALPLLLPARTAAARRPRTSAHDSHLQEVPR